MARRRRGWPRRSRISSKASERHRCNFEVEKKDKRHEKKERGRGKKRKEEEGKLNNDRCTGGLRCHMLPERERRRKNKRKIKKIKKCAMSSSTWDATYSRARFNEILDQDDTITKFRTSICAL